LNLKRFFFRKKKEEKEETNPWTAPKKESKSKVGFGSYLKSGAESFGVKSGGAINAFRRSRFHVKVFLKLKRVCYGFLFIFYVAMALMSITNPVFIILFALTAYAFLENLLWTRHYQWSKRKKEHEEQA